MLAADLPVLPPAAEAVARQVAACGFPDAKPRYDDRARRWTIATPRTEASSEALTRAARAAAPAGYAVQFARDQPDVRVYYAAVDAVPHAGARAWLGQHGLLATLPRHDPAHPDLAATTRAVERLCGSATDGALKITGTIVSMTMPATPIGSDTYLCLENATTASGLPTGRSDRLIWTKGTPVTPR